MSNVTTLKSYLVSLGFDSNMGQYHTNFEAPIKAASTLVKGETFKIAADVLKWQTSIIGMFAAISTGVITTMDKVAMADQSYRLFGERMFMDTAHARSLKVAMDALGLSLEEIAFDRESHERFSQLIQDQKAMTGGLGGDFEENMKRIRDVRFEFTRLKVEMQYLAMGATNSIFKALGFESDDFLTNLRKLNDYIIHNIPYLSEQFAKYLVPVLKDTKEIMGEVWDVTKEGAVVFQNLIGLLSGDTSLEGTTASFDKMAHSIEHVIGWLKEFLDAVFKAEEMLAHTIEAGEFLTQGNFSAASKEMREAFKQLTAGSGAIAGAVTAPSIGALIGGALGVEGGPVGIALGAGIGSAAASVVGGALGYGVGTINQHFQGSTTPQALFASPVGSARQIASQIGLDLHLPANIQKYLFEQMAFETGGFKNRGVGFNNFAGIKDSKGEYQHFDSVQDFIKRYEQVLSAHRYAGLFDSKNELEFATIAKQGGWYADDATGKAASPMQYAGGMVRYGDTYDINVHVTQPNASADQIAQAVHSKLKQEQGSQTAYNVRNLEGAY
jgi:methyl-accepting chemotaxis protein